VFWIILLVLAVLITGGCALAAAATANNKAAWIGGAVGTPILFVVLTLLMAVHQIGSGELGIVYSMAGVVNGQVGPGMQTIMPWNSVTVVDTKTQSVVFDGLTAFSKESQDITGKIQVNYHLDPTAVQTLYKAVGPNWYDKYIPGAVTQDFKEIITQYMTTELAPNRAVIAQQLLNKLKADLLPHSIYIDNAYVLNIGYSSQFTAAIEAKQVASQKVQQAQLEAQAVVAQAKGQADANVELAKGNAAATVAEAQGQATANKDLTSSLSDLLIRYQQVQKLSPNIKVIIAPTSGNLLNLGGLTTP
jgi:regulator of protease activity HflC (stomatin/prohibitin superfamily)